MTRNAFVTADARGQRLTIAEAETRDEAQLSGAWIKSDTVMEIEQ